MKKKFLFFVLSVIFALCAVVTAPISNVHANGVISVGELTVHFIDVGQGDACIVELPDDRTMLIDAGENRVEVRERLDRYITQNIKDDEGNVIEYFDFVIITHSDSDHIGSMRHVLQNYRGLTVYRPNEECSYTGCHDHANEGAEARNRFWGTSHGDKGTATYHNVLETVYETADEVIVTNPYDETQNKITSTTADEYEINFYSPLSPDYNDHNNYSPIVIIEYMGRKIVVTGDAEQQNETEFVAAAAAGEGRYAIFDQNYCVDVIKLGHHGSRTSSSEGYLDVVTKANRRSGVFVVISCGEGNSYGHPHQEVLTRLSDMGFAGENILRTDIVGDIVISVKQVDGVYKVVYDDRAGGAGDAQPDLLSMLIERFNSLELYQKILVVVAVIVIIVLIIVIVVNYNKKHGKNKKSKSSDKSNLSGKNKSSTKSKSSSKTNNKKK